MKREIKQTADGSYTIYLPEHQEHYHSCHGAITESMHVFIKHGLEVAQEHVAALRIVEVGAGTGLNFFLTALHAKVPVHYTAIEPFPVTQEIHDALQYRIGSEEIRQAYIQAPPNCDFSINDRLTLHKIDKPLQEITLPSNYFHLVYYDAFAPRVQPELWQRAIFAQLATAMAPGGILTTYCCKGEVKRNMQAAGLQTLKQPGPPGKREMLTALKP